jgi:hypothetical protein
MIFYAVGDRFTSRYYNFARHALRGNSVHVPKGHYDLLSMHIKEAKRLNADALLLSNPIILKSLTTRELGAERASNSLHNWAGATFTVDGVKIIVVRSFDQLVQSPEAEFLLRWYVRKQFVPEFPEIPEMQWAATDSTKFNIQRLYT